MTTSTDTQTCGVIVTTAKGNQKPCAKPLGHDGNHSTSVRREYALLDMKDMGTFKLVENPNDAKKLAPKTHPGVQAQERSPVLKELDIKNADLYAQWVAKGKEKEYTKSPLGKLHVPAEKVDGTKFLIRKSAEFLGHGLEFGDLNVKDTGGRHVVSWRVIDKRERKAKAS